ncbi:MAG: hypothetical protein H7066_08475 [Cytophagaceae bacterium]|nr:hypothetical protein [Gemmatimonadaceae bacterium]
MSFYGLDAGKILETQARLAQRIEERFPGSGLGRLSRDLLGLSRDCAREAESLGRPNWPLRVGTGAVGAAMLGVVAYAIVNAARLFGEGNQGLGVVGLVQALEAVINDVVFLGIALFFLASIETRLKRRKALRWLHQLRAVAHIVDMHQLTKDPDRLLMPQDDTKSSPERVMTRAELGRYLDYCSELLSVTGKVAALFVQYLGDSVVLQAVNEIEDLTNGLARKIWQKITLLQGS